MTVENRKRRWETVRKEKGKPTACGFQKRAPRCVWPNRSVALSQGRGLGKVCHNSSPFPHYFRTLTCCETTAASTFVTVVGVLQSSHPINFVTGMGPLPRVVPASENRLFSWPPVRPRVILRRVWTFFHCSGPSASGLTSGALPTTPEPWEMWPGAVFIFAWELALQVLFVELLAFFYDPHSHVEFCDMHFYFNFISGAILCSYPCFSIFSSICFRFTLFYVLL